MSEYCVDAGGILSTASRSVDYLTVDDTGYCLIGGVARAPSVSMLHVSSSVGAPPPRPGQVDPKFTLVISTYPMPAGGRFLTWQSLMNW